MAILAAAGIQSPFSAPTRLWQGRYDRLADRRSQSDHPSVQFHPDPRSHPSSATPRPVILTAVGIQSPFGAATRLWQGRYDRGWPTGVLNRTIRQCNFILILDPIPHPQLPAPSFSPQWESRALSVRQRGCGKEDTIGWPTGVLNRTIRQCNPILILDPIPHPQLPAPSFSPQWESIALSVRQRGCGKEDTIGWPTGVLNRTIRQCNFILILDPIPHPQLPAPSFSPQWESRALSVRQRGCGKEDTIGRPTGVLNRTIRQCNPS